MTELACPGRVAGRDLREDDLEDLERGRTISLTRRVDLLGFSNEEEEHVLPLAAEPHVVVVLLLLESVLEVHHLPVEMEELEELKAHQVSFEFGHR